MPSMSNRYFAIHVSQAVFNKEVSEGHDGMAAEKKWFEDYLSDRGLVRGAHYTLSLTSLSELDRFLGQDVSDTSNGTILWKVNFRSKKCFDLSRAFDETLVNQTLFSPSCHGQMSELGPILAH